MVVTNAERRAIVGKVFSGQATSLFLHQMGLCALQQMSPESRFTVVLKRKHSLKGVPKLGSCWRISSTNNLFHYMKRFRLATEESQPCAEEDYEEEFD